MPHVTGVSVAAAASTSDPQPPVGRQLLGERVVDERPVVGAVHPVDQRPHPADRDRFEQALLRHDRQERRQPADDLLRGVEHLHAHGVDARGAGGEVQPQRLRVGPERPPLRRVGLGRAAELLLRADVGQLARGAGRELVELAAADDRLRAVPQAQGEPRQPVPGAVLRDARDLDLRVLPDRLRGHLRQPDAHRGPLVLLRGRLLPRGRGGRILRGRGGRVLRGGRSRRRGGRRQGRRRRQHGEGHKSGQRGRAFDASHAVSVQAPPGAGPPALAAPATNLAAS